MRELIQPFFSELHDVVEMFWWSFIKAPLAFIAAWGFFSMLADPANVADKTMQMARSGSLPQEVMTGIVTVWFLCGCAVLGLSIFTRLIFKARLFQSVKRDSQGNSALYLHS